MGQIGTGSPGTFDGTPSSVHTSTDYENVADPITDDSKRADAEFADDVQSAILDVESVLSNREPFRADVGAGGQEKTITFANAKSNTNYAVVGLCCDWAFGVRVKPSSRQTTQFVVQFDSPAPTGGGRVYGEIVEGAAVQNLT